MAHKHTFDDGRETGSEIVDPIDPLMHWHIANGMVTSTAPFGENHTHLLDGAETGGPMATEDEPTILDMDNEDEEKTMKRENKFICGRVVECKQEDRNGVPIGIIKGYIATWDIDRGSWGVKDQFQKGAFLESINELRAKNRPIRFKDHHGRTIGGFPIATVIEDEKGLFGVAEVNLDVQQGKEAFSLAKQGVLSDFSIGFSSVEDSEVNTEQGRIRVITKAIVWEGSIVDEPMNPHANVTEVKTIEMADVQDWTEKDIEKCLHEGTKLSKKAAKFLVSKMKGEKAIAPPYNVGELSDLVASIKGIKV